MDIVGGRQEQIRLSIDGNLVVTPESNEKITILLGINRVNIYRGNDGWVIETNKNVDVETIAHSSPRAFIPGDRTIEDIHYSLQKERFE